MNLIYNPVYAKPGKVEDAEQDIEAARKDPDFQDGGSGLGAPYHVRVLIPCYKEPFEIVQRTVSAIRDAVLPAGERHHGPWPGPSFQENKLLLYCTKFLRPARIACL